MYRRHRSRLVQSLAGKPHARSMARRAERDEYRAAPRPPQLRLIPADSLPTASNAAEAANNPIDLSTLARERGAASGIFGGAKSFRIDLLMSLCQVFVGRGHAQRWHSDLGKPQPRQRQV